MNEAVIECNKDDIFKKAVINSYIGKKMLESSNFVGVIITVKRLKSQYDNMRNTYYNIPDDLLLHVFRKRAGLSAPGKSLDGWYGNDIFHTFGQYLSGFVRMYEATGDTQVLKKTS